MLLEAHTPTATEALLQGPGQHDAGSSSDIQSPAHPRAKKTSTDCITW